MRTLKLTATVSATLLCAVAATAQTTPLNRLELARWDRCDTKKLDSRDQVRCFAWATSQKSGGIKHAQARCTKPEFVRVAKDCLNAHRLKKEFRGQEEQICVEFNYLFAEPVERYGMTNRVLVTSTRELPTCEMNISPVGVVAPQTAQSLPEDSAGAD